MHKGIGISFLVASMMFTACSKTEHRAARSKTEHRELATIAHNQYGHFSDCEKLCAELNAEGIDCLEGAIDLGGMDLFVDSRDLALASKAAQRIVARDSLTLCLHPDGDFESFEEWQNGKKIKMTRVQMSRNEERGAD